MLSLVKNVFTFSKNNDADINAKINKIETIIKDIEKQKHVDLPLKVKNILNIAFGDSTGPSLFQQIYRSCMFESPIQWVPKMGRLLNLFSANSPFMKIIMQAFDFKISLQKNLLPVYLFRNNLINQKSAYHNISSSITGMTVPLFDYVIIRLVHGLSVSSFISETGKDFNEQYDSDDFFFYLSRNPFLLALKNLIDTVGNSQKPMTRIANILKIFFVDQLLLKHRTNKSPSYLKELSNITTRYTLKPQNLLAIYLLLHKGKIYFQQKSLFLYELAERFQSIIQSENQICFRFLFRVYTYAFSKNAVQNKVIDSLRKSNPVEGYFELSRYSIDEFKFNIGSAQRKQKIQYNQSKPLLLKMLEKDQNILASKKVHFSTLRTLGAFLCLQNQMSTGGNLFGSQQNQDFIRKVGEADKIEIGFEKMYRSLKPLMNNKNSKKIKFSVQNQQKLKDEINQIVQLIEKAYNRKIDLSKYEDYKQSTLDRSFNIMGNNKDYVSSVESYKREIELNVWQVPLKDSQYQVLFDLFYALAKWMDEKIPGYEKGQQPRINLRYFSNPLVFMLSMIVLMLTIKMII